MTGRRSRASSKTPAEGLVAAVRRVVPETCLETGALNKEGCTVRLKGAPAPRLVIDFDKPDAPLGTHSSRCDYLFLAEASGPKAWVVPLELKKGKAAASGVEKQLQAGADAAGRLLPPAMPVRFRPIVVSRGTHKNEREKLKRLRVRYRGTREPIRQLGCDRQLVDALRPASRQ